MMNRARSKAEEKFAKIKQQDKKALKERMKAQHEITEKVARLRALRLAKEASGKESSDREAADKAAAKSKTPSKSVRATRRKPVIEEKAATEPDID